MKLMRSKPSSITTTFMATLAIFILFKAPQSFASPSEETLSFWQGIKPYGSEEHDYQARYSFYELGRYFNALDHWRRDIYRPIKEQKNWKAFRKDIQKHPIELFIKLSRDYKTDSDTKTQIFFQGDWHTNLATPDYSFSVHSTPGKKVSNTLGAMQGELQLKQADSNNDNTNAQFSANVFLDTLLFTEFLESTEAINQLLSIERLKQLNRANKTQQVVPQHFSEIETLIHKQFHYALPTLMSTLEKISKLEKLAEQQFTPNGTPVTRIQHIRKVDLKGLKKHFPDTYRDFKTFLKSISHRTEILVEGNKRLGAFSYDAETNRFKADLALAGPAIVLQTLNGELTDETLYPTQLKSLDYQISNTLNIEMFGLDISVEGLMIDANYIVENVASDSKQKRQIQMQMNQSPKIEVKGALLYILPTWLIDLLIPGTLETLIADAFGDLIEGIDGQGVLVSFVFEENNGKHIVNVDASADMPHELLQAILKIEKEERADQTRLYNSFRKSLRQDFASFASKFNDPSIDHLTEHYLKPE